MAQQELVSAIQDKVTGVSDADWSELAQMSGMQIHPDQLRKMGQGIKQVAEAGMLAAGGVPVLPADSYATQRIRDLQTELNAAHRAVNRSDALRDAVIEAARHLPTIERQYPVLRKSGMSS